MKKLVLILVLVIASAKSTKVSAQLPITDLTRIPAVNQQMNHNTTVTLKPSLKSYVNYLFYIMIIRNLAFISYIPHQIIYMNPNAYLNNDRLVNLKVQQNLMGKYEAIKPEFQATNK